jgi:DNA-binding CsgD family transcriptional regulator
MEFKNEELVEREIEIGKLLIQNISLKEIGEKTGLSSKLVNAHIKNMMQKMTANDLQLLIRVLKHKFN